MICHSRLWEVREYSEDMKGMMRYVLALPHE